MSVSAIRVALRADASAIMGLGHIKRCLSLAAALRDAGAQVRLVSRDLGVDIEYIISGIGIEHVVLPKPATGLTVVDSVPHAEWAGVDWHYDAVQSVEVLKEWRPDWVVVDEYAFDARWHQYVSSQLHTSISVIDDLADRDLFADVLVDHNFHERHADKYRGLITDRTVILGGPRFALLGAAYANAKSFSVRASVASIGIFMGGIDAADLTGAVLRACREQAGFTGDIEIVMTRSYVHGAQLKTLAAQWPNTSLSCDLPDLAEFFARHDLQIGAGGGATWERCSMGAPTLVLIAAANQQAVLPALADLGAATVLMHPASFDVQAIGKAVKSLLDDPERRLELSKRSQALVDGWGARRVALKLAASAVVVRPATLEDSQMMYRWRNHPATRSVSRESQEIAWPNHQRWLAQTLANPKRCLLVGYVGNINIGVIRFDIGAEGQAEVSLYLDPGLHSLGLGGAMLRAGEAYVASHNANIADFVATVLDGNQGSMRMFESGGYRLQEDVWCKRVNSPLKN